MTPEQRGFEDLECYKLSLQVLKAGYALAKQLPGVERYNLADQIRRAAVSATLNIAEGYGRYHYLDRLRFFYYARGSLMETLSGFVDCQAVGYVDQAELDRLRQLTHSALRSLNGYIRYVRKKQQGQREYGTEVVREREALYIVVPEDFPDDRPICQFPIYQSPTP